MKDEEDSIRIAFAATIPAKLGKVCLLAVMASGTLSLEACDHLDRALIKHEFNKEGNGMILTRIRDLGAGGFGNVDLVEDSKGARYA